MEDLRAWVADWLDTMEYQVVLGCAQPADALRVLRQITRRSAGLAAAIERDGMRATAAGVTIKAAAKAAEFSRQELARVVCG